MNPDEYWATPTLTGSQVRLEALAPEHADGLLAAADDDAVFEHLTIDRPHDRAAALALIEAYRDDARLAAWAQVDAASGRVAGMTTYYDIDPVQRTVAIGHTWLGSAFWRTGVNTDAKLLLLARAFDDLACVRVVWHTDARNQRSQNAIARLGAQREGTLRKHKRRRDGSWRDTAIFSMTDEEWPAARETLRRSQGG